MHNKVGLDLSILDQFTPDILGIFWITDTKLDRNQDGFNDFNYLFDGLISQYIYSQESKSDQHAHIFFTNNYEQKIFLAHLATKDLAKSKIAGDIDEQVSLVQNLLPARKTILILDQTNDHWITDLQKRYAHLDFKLLK